MKSKKHFYRVAGYDGHWVVRATSPRAAKDMCRQYRGQRLTIKRTTATEFKRFNQLIQREHAQ